MAPLRQARIPAFYRIFFTWIDPAISIPSIWAHFTAPDTILDAYIPKSMSVRNPEHDMLFFHLAGSFMTIAVMSAVLLRYTSDLGVWRIVQSGIILYDFELLYSLWHFMGKQGRLDPTIWRLEDWGNWAIVGTVILVRLAFLSGAGLKKTNTKGKRS
ncbi:hypothetical protein J7T55_010687 [Diaporthe amygdali]|uniref:uncharacterized protein n=1 Tax=Phomopsis amygdali TaxID=1214568 RepID=UPI0022FE07FE|nr:uncharacterized protein J7T55_010687 [Diaporthe amygdali]KAJ0114298.1 hypothetical protein J7T55_010687 [Diaporthe amygdali]